MLGKGGNLSNVSYMYTHIRLYVPAEILKLILRICKISSALDNVTFIGLGEDRVRLTQVSSQDSQDSKDVRTCAKLLVQMWRD